MDIFITQQFYRKPKSQNEIFDLEITFRQETNQLVLTSSVIPQWLIDEVFFNYEEILVDAPRFDAAKVQLVINDVANEIIKHRYASKYFFPTSWLDSKGRVMRNHLGGLYECKGTFRHYAPNWLTRESKYQSFLLEGVFWKAIAGVSPAKILSVKNISRKEWELLFESENQVEYYLSVYHEVAFAVTVVSNGCDPSFSAIMNKQRKILAAFLTHSKVVNE